MKRNQTTYYSTSTVTDLYSDAYYLQLAIEAVAAGLMDSNAVVSNFENSVVYDVYLLETALISGDSAIIANAANNMPHDDMGDNFSFVASTLASSELWTTEDSTQIWSIAYQRIDEGGPAVIIARNMLGIYVDDTTLPPKSKKAINRNNIGTFINIVPNPNTGKFTLTSNIALPSEIKIIDSLGKTIYQSKLSTIATELNIENLENGFYHLSIFDGAGKIKSTRFVISK